ncbi:MAG: transposase [Flavobacteriaceae bacterium]|nr:transposase [Flavobacteriaceae bacterium]
MEFLEKFKEIFAYDLTCKTTGKNLFQRKRIFTFENCIYSFLLNGVHRFSLGSSRLLAMMYADGVLDNSKNIPLPKNYNKACDKISSDDIDGLVKNSFALESQSKEEFYHDLRVTIVDGTHIIVPRTKKTIAEFGLGSGSVGDAFYPQTQSVGFFNLSTGLFECFTSKNIKTPERKFMQEHAKENNTPTLYLGDAGYNGMGNVLIILFYNQDILMQLKMGTMLAKEFGKKSKRRSQIFEIIITDVHLRNYPEFKHLKGQKIKIRLVRTRGTTKLKSQILLTTLLDEKKFGWEELSKLYLQRYKVELAFRHLKSVIGIEKIKKEKIDRIKQLLSTAILLFNISVMLRNTIKQNSILPEPMGTKVYCLQLTTDLVPKLIEAYFFSKNKLIKTMNSCIKAIKSCFSINRPWRTTVRICQFPCSTFTKQKTSRKNSELAKVVYLKPEYTILGCEYGML